MKNKMENYLIVVRSYNDIDHMTPLIDYLAKNHIAKIYLFSSVPLGLIYPNENLDYLKRKYGLEPKYLLDPNKYFFISILDTVYVSIKNYKTNKILNEISEKLLTKLIIFTRKLLIKSQLYFLSNNIEQIVSSIKPNLVCYDWTDPSRFPLSVITNNAKKLNIPVIGLPHSVIVYEKFDLDYNSIREKEYKRHAKGQSFDWQITYGELGEMHLVNEGYPKNKIKCLGSLRFEKEWIRIQEKNIINKEINLSVKGKIKIVLFPNKLMYSAKPDAIISLIQNVSQIGTLIIKPHTRKMTLNFLNDTIGKYDVKIVRDSYSSSELIKWCDVGILWGGSIGLQLLMMNKSLIYAKHAHSLPTIYEKYLPEIVVNNDSMLIEMIKKINGNKGKVNYKQENADLLINDLVYAGSITKNVNERYIKFFESLMKN